MENLLFDLKIKELTALKKTFEVKNDILIVLEKTPVVLGCRACYMVQAEPTINGFAIEAGFLINYYEKFKESCTAPKEIAMNIWLCPVCNRVFRELVPNLNTGYICQPINK